MSPPPQWPAPLSQAVLVADDSAVVRAKLKRSLEAQGWRVSLAADGVQALQMLDGQRFNLLITDLEMPRMDGRELIAAVHGRAGFAALPVLAITGHEQPEAGGALGANVHAVLRKPWSDGELLDAIATVAVAGREGALLHH